MSEQQRLCWVILLTAVFLVACQPKTVQPQAAPAVPVPSASPIPLLSPTPTPPPTPSPFPTFSPSVTPTLTPSPSPSPTPVASTTELPSSTVWPPPLTLPYTPTDDDDTGRIRGRLAFPSNFIPPLMVYAVATDGSRFYRVDTDEVPPGEPSYEIPAVEPGTYYVYGYRIEGDASLGGAYSYLAACEAGHFPPPDDGCWDDPQHDLAPVEVLSGQAVEEVNISDWYGPPLSPPPDDTGD
ncbi:MAG: hypothetical protein V3S14_11045 [Anaerolineae bacterium]